VIGSFLPATPILITTPKFFPSNFISPAGYQNDSDAALSAWHNTTIYLRYCVVRFLGRGRTDSNGSFLPYFRFTVFSANWGIQRQSRQASVFLILTSQPASLDDDNLPV
jgi:hypothetical protein